MAKKDIHYNLDKIDKLNKSLNIIYGERSNGKSYQVKHKKGIIKYIETGKRFILLRRLREELRTELIEQYFCDVDVSRLTKGKYNCITSFRKNLYFTYCDPETMKKTRGDHIGYCVALSTEQNYAGASYLDVEDIIFEEFMSRSVYLPNEPNKLMNFYATVDRKRLTTKLWLVGNSISRVCPYLEEWGLLEKIKSLKQGEITTLQIQDMSIAIEYCLSTGRTSGTIGTNAKMINTGAWESSPQPHLPYSIKECKILYKIGFQYKGFKFLGMYISHLGKEKPVWFIQPYYKDFKENTLIFSDYIKPDKYWQRDIYNISIKNDKIKNILYNFRENNIFYSDDLTGTDFKQAIDFIIRR